MPKWGSAAAPGSLVGAMGSALGRWLVAAGALTAAGMAAAYRAKHTAAFKTCYALTWPLLGSGVIIVGNEAYAPKSRAELEAKLGRGAEKTGGKKE